MARLQFCINEKTWATIRGCGTIFQAFVDMPFILQCFISNKILQVLAEHNSVQGDTFSTSFVGVNEVTEARLVVINLAHSNSSSTSRVGL
jgi:hypothetical protein